MANVRYVNPDSTSGGNGTTNATAGANRAYASLNEWEAARQANLADVEECVCETGGTADSTDLTIDGWTTTASFYILIHASAGHRHAGKWDAAKYRYTGHVTNWEDYVRFEYLQFRATSGNIFTLMSGAGADVRIGWCVFDGSTGTAYIIRAEHTKQAIHNCVFNNNATSVTYVIRTGGSGTPTVGIYNVSIRGTNSNDGGIFASGGTFNCRNVVVFNTQFESFANIATLNLNYCKSDDTYADNFGGTGNVADVTMPGSIFVDASTGDLHLQSGDTILKDAGQDLSSDPDSYGGSIGTALATDIDGETRTGTWDIGADEYVAAGGGTKAPPIFRRRVRWFRRVA